MLKNCEKIVKISAFEVWEFLGLSLFHGLSLVSWAILDAFWDTSDWWKIKILVAFLIANYWRNFLRYVGKLRKTRIWYCLVASLIGLEWAGDRFSVFCVGHAKLHVTYLKNRTDLGVSMTKNLWFSSSLIIIFVTLHVANSKCLHWWLSWIQWKTCIHCKCMRLRKNSTSGMVDVKHHISWKVNSNC